MKAPFIGLFAAAVACSSGVSAQELAQATAAAPPATKLEAFSARTGIVLIKGYTELGSVSGLGSVEVDAREFRDASNPKLREYGSTFTVKESGRLERESNCLVDYDELDSLMKGIEYVGNADKGVTPLANFEAEFRTKGNLSVTTFSQRQGGIGLAISCGRIGKTTAYLKQGDMPALKALVLKAKGILDQAKAAVH